MPVKLLLSIFALFVFALPLKAQNSTNSILSDGQIYKMSIPQTGVYKLDYNYLDQTVGLDLGSIDPRNIHIYSNPGGPVPQENNDPRVDDLNELNIYIKGETDGSFDTDDYILLYAEGADRYATGETGLEFEKNVYDLNNYLFLKVDSNPGSRVENRASVDVTSYSNETESIQRHENEWTNLLASFSSTQGTGKIWYGEPFANNLTQDFDSYFSFPNLVPNSDAKLEIELAARSNSSSEFNINIDGQSFSTIHSSTNTGDIESIYARDRKLSTTVNLVSPNPSIQLQYRPNAANSEAWLDYIEIKAREFTSYSGSPLFIYDSESVSNPTHGFQITTAASPLIWDVTDITNITGQSYENRGGSINFGYDTEGTTRIFAVFEDNQNHPQPEFISLVGNQNLHAIERADFLIVYYHEFREAAMDLAEHRRNNDNMIVETVDIDMIYNEFGGGRKEPTALRDFARMLYNRDVDFQYMLLMGDASYDFRGLDQNINYENFVPTFETLESLDPIEGFPTDDFFALLTANEGEESLKGALDIGVGRIPCKTAAEANAVVNKIIHYDTSPACFGEWRQQIGFAADDQDIPIDKVHVVQSDGIANIVEGRHPEFNQQKIYFDAFSQESTPGGQRYPDANAAINDNINQGMLTLGYLGHGGPKGWAQERVLQINDVLSWDSYNNLPILITATCSFTGFDEPTFVSAGEHAMLNPNGGVIALFTTVRAVYSSSNRRLTEEVFKKIFARNVGKRLRLGDIVKESQNANSADTTRSNSRKFMLIGDPSLTIAMPEHRIVVDEINNVIVGMNEPDTLGALDRATIEGRVINAIDSTDMFDFNGEIFLTVYDKKADRRTLDNDNIGSTYEFDIRNSILYKGSASVVDGYFSIDFILPKDINFEYGEAKLSFYATDNATTDAGGYYDNVIVGGISENIVEDNVGPEINIYMDNRSFSFGDQTSANPLMIVDLEDENGINLSSTSIGHDITAYIDDRTGVPLVLNDFFTPTIDQLGAGTVQYQLQNLELGLHKVYVKAWDILNNSNEEMTEFFVAEDDEGFVKDIYNYPNPFNNMTTFKFEHDLNSSNIDVQISIYSMGGVLVKTLREQKFNSGGRIDDIIWNGRDEIGGLLPNGVYIYKIKLSTSEFNEQRESDFQKLVILN